MLDTQRLVIRTFAPSDAGDLHACLSREQVVRFAPYPTFDLEYSLVRLLEKLSFTREGYRRQNALFNRDENDRPLWQDTFECGCCTRIG